MALSLKVGYQLQLDVRDYTRSDGRIGNNADKIVSSSPNGNMGKVDYAASTEITWASSDASKATISSKGILVALAAGSTTITATIPKRDGSGNITATLAITVVAGDDTESAVIVPRDYAAVPKINYTPGNYNSDTD